MSVERGITSSASQVLSLSEGNMLVLGILIAFGQTEVDNINVVLGGFCGSNQEIVWLDVTVDDALLVDLLNSLNLH